MKRLFRFYFFSIFIIIVSCAPKNLPPPLYGGIELTLDEVISRSGDGIDGIKAVLEIDIEKDDSQSYRSSASIIIKKPGMVHIKTYNLGILTGDIIVKGDDIHILYGRMNKGLEPFIKVAYDTVFWWDGVRNGHMHKDNDLYIIRKDGRELHLDSATLLPVKQSAIIDGRRFHITYNKPVREGNFWYPSFLEITMDDYRLYVKIERLFVNPSIKEEDFVYLQTSDREISQRTQ